MARPICSTPPWRPLYQSSHRSLRAVEDGKRLVAGVGVPGAGDGKEDRVVGMALPAGDAVARAGQADLGAVLVAKTDVKHDMPVAGKGSTFVITMPDSTS